MMPSERRLPPRNPVDRLLRALLVLASLTAAGCIAVLVTQPVASGAAGSPGSARTSLWTPEPALVAGSTTGWQLDDRQAATAVLAGLLHHRYAAR
jgi:hypothetical protein